MSKRLGSNVLAGWIDDYTIESVIERCIRKRKGADDPDYVSTGSIELTPSLRCDELAYLADAIANFAPNELKYLNSAISNVVTWIIPGSYCNPNTTPQWDRWLESWNSLSRGLANIALCNWLEKQKHSVADIISEFVAWRVEGMTKLNAINYTVDDFCNTAGLPDEFRKDFIGSLRSLSSSEHIAGIIKAMMSIKYSSYSHSKEISGMLQEQLEALVCSNSDGKSQTQAEKDDEAEAALLESLPNLKRVKENPDVIAALDEILAAQSDVGWKLVVLTGIKIGFDGDFERFAAAMSGQRRAVSGRVIEQILTGNSEVNLRRDTLFTLLHTLGIRFNVITWAIRDYMAHKIDGKFADPDFSLQDWHRNRNGANSWNTRARKGESKSKSKSKKPTVKPKSKAKSKGKQSTEKKVQQQELVLTVKTQEPAIKPSNGVVTHANQLRMQRDAVLGRMVRRAVSSATSKEQLGLVVQTCVETAEELISNAK